MNYAVLSDQCLFYSLIYFILILFISFYFGNVVIRSSNFEDRITKLPK